MIEAPQTTLSHLTIIPEPDLIAQQLRLELRMSEKGAEAARRAVEKARDMGREGTTRYGRILMETYIDRMADRLTEWMRPVDEGKARRKAVAAPYLKEVGDYRRAAFVALSAILSGLSRGPSRSKLVRRIGVMMEDEVRLRDARTHARQMVDRLLFFAQDRVSYAQRRASVLYHLNREKEAIPWEGWPSDALMAVGTVMLELAHAAGLVVFSSTTVHPGQGKGRPKSEITVLPSPAVDDWIARQCTTEERLAVNYEPMIVPPQEWTSGIGGGYLSAAVRPLRLVRGIGQRYLREFTPEAMPKVFAAINAAQAVPWRINRFTLDVVTAMWERDFSEAGIPPKHDPEIPPKPLDIDTDEEARRAWRRAAHAVHQEIKLRASSRSAFATSLSIATAYSLFPALYIPCQFDFRGRLYAAAALHPQGPDWMRGMLEFAEGHPLDDESAPWLALHLANCGDFKVPSGAKASKAPLGERIQWVYDNETAILDCFRDPFANRLWVEADQPIQFLAACREWALWREAQARGEEFSSHLPVALDGSCSGIQHFSMAWRDEVGGAAVNLVPGLPPADIYSLVMQKATAALAEIDHDETADHDARTFANQWRTSGLLTRSTFKRPTMTFGYGSEVPGFSDQIRKDVLAPAYREHEERTRRGELSSWPFEGVGHRAARFLAVVTYDAVTGTVVKAGEAMRWLKEVGGIIGGQGRFVQWTTPDGFKVRQGYCLTTPYRVEAMLLGRRVQTQLVRQLNQPDARQQSTRLPPNLIHSWDACHLRAVALAAHREGIQLQLIHDSFGTHAAHTGRLFKILRETLVAQYEAPVVARLAEELQGQIPEEPLPLPPALGNLDIQGVLDTDFSFA